MPFGARTPIPVTTTRLRLIIANDKEEKGAMLVPAGLGIIEMLRMERGEPLV